ncbi:MAG: LamG domain-containing protein [Gammaproteobacteria bacterium]|nr:LamG domain-containing protein [Gammaproteobacteria bacterium]
MLLLIAPAGLLFAAPGDILFQDDFESGLGNWTVSNGSGEADISTATASSGINSLYLSERAVTVTSNVINTNVPEAELAVWIRRGDDSFSENPDASEDLLVQYLNQSSVWTTLEAFAGDGTPGQIYQQVYPLPADALHIGFQIRFSLLGGSGNNFDYWHVDDVVVTETGIPSGPIADWRMDELSWSGDTGEVIDWTGNGYDGTSVNANVIAGFLCNAADLSPTGTSDYVKLNPTSMDNLGDFTVSVWVNTSETAAQTLLSAAQTDAQPNEAVFYFDSSTAFWPTLRETPFDTGTQLTLSNTFNDGSWHHLAWVRTRGNSQTCLYIDSSLQGCVTHTNGANFLDIANNGLLVGQEQDSIEGGFDSTQAWNGLIDELLVFNTALSASSVSSIYTNQLAGNNWDGSARVCPTPIPEPIAEWRMDEAGWIGATGEVQDQTVNNLDLTAFNGALNLNTTPAIAGDPGTCYYGDFNGTNQYLEIADNPLLDIANNLTITTWINPRALPGSGLKTIVSKNANYEFHLTPSGEINWWWGGGVNELTTSGASISPNNWYHIAITYRSGEQKIYVNGTELANTNVTGTLSLNNSPLQIGQDQNFVGRFFNGLIDEVRIYDQTLTAANVNQIMMETHPCSGIGICNVSYQDDFSSGSFNGGSTNWSSPWQESNDNNNASSGKVVFSGGQVSFNNQSNPNNDPGISRSLDLSASTTATLDIDISTPGTLENGDRFEVLISTNNGTSYTLLESIANDFTGIKSYDITPYLSATTRILLQIENGYRSNDEFIFINDVTITSTEACVNNLIDITHDGNAINCFREPIQIEIEDPLGTVQTAYTGTINLTVNSGNGVWSTTPESGASPDPANGTLTNSGLGDGSATYTFTLADAGSVVLYLQNTVAESVNIDATDGAAVDDNSEGLLTFRPFGFVTSPTPVPTQIAGRPFNVTLTAAGQTPGTTSCGVIEEYTGDRPLNFWSILNSPATSPTSMQINGASIATNEASSTPQTVTFASGIATISVQYNDVGSLSFAVKDDVGIGDPVSSTGDEVIGSVLPFVVRPFAYDIDVRYSDTSVVNALDPSAPVLAVAGDTFSHTLRSVQWQADDDTNNDGVADTGANLADNPITPNIVNIPNSGGNVAFSPSAEIVTNSNGVLGTAAINFNAFGAVGSAGQGTANFQQSWTEVGILTLSSLSNNFLAGGENVTGSRTGIGRFIPADFLMTFTDNYDAQCNTFSYSGFDNSVISKASQIDSVSIDITARNRSGSVTQNYEAGFAKLEAGSISYTAFNNDTSATATGSLVAGLETAPDFVAGIASSSSGVPFQLDDIGYLFEDFLSPFSLQLNFNAADSDSVIGSVSSSAVEQRIGRAVLQSVYGSELESLEVPLQTQFFNGTNWQVNTDDSCTSYQASDISFITGSYSGDLNSGETLVTSPAALTNITNGTTAINQGFWFSPPGFGNSGQVDVEFNLAPQPWLQFDWDGNNTIDSPRATVGFGRYRGSDRVIFWKER